MDSSDKLGKKLASMPAKGNFLSRLVLKFYRGYTLAQERRTPAMQAFRQALQKKFKDEVPPNDFRQRFRMASLPLMKYTNILSFNTRCFALFIAIAVKMPWLYFVFELTVLNVILIYMVLKHESICRQFTKELK